MPQYPKAIVRRRPQGGETKSAKTPNRVKSGSSSAKVNGRPLRYAEAVINTIHKPLVVLDDKLRVVSANRWFFRFFGATRGDTLGRRLHDADAHHLDISALREFLDRLKDGAGGGVHCELAADLPSIGKRSLVAAAEEIHGPKITDGRIVISFDDVTDFKAAERQLELAKQAAELANLAKSRFLAAASHDLRQPLQTLTLLHASLKEEISSREGLELLAKADHTLDTMTGVLTTLLDINQLDAGVVRPKLLDFAVDEILVALKSEFAEQVRRKNLDWHVVPAGLSVRSDRRLLAEMARNLVSNAVRYTDKGKILLGCRRCGESVRIEVWDTGVGIAEHEIPRIFQEYRQAMGSAPRGGLGLGLAIVQHLGDLLGHAVRVRSEVGKGSVFSIEVPLALTEAEPTRERQQRIETERRRAGRILIIEDDVAVRESLQLMLEAEGHQVFATASREAALALVANGAIRPDIVISDYTLSGVTTGTDVAAALHASLASSVPIIILTGDIRTATSRAIAANGCISLCKPVKAENLAKIVQELLVGRCTTRDEPADDQTAEPLGEESATTIFVIDDDRQAREAMGSLLTKAGYRVKSYASAQAFLGAYNADEKGCLLTDVRMPGMNGFELLAQFVAGGHQLPAIVITGQGDIATAVQAMKAGAVDFIEKPFKPEALLACIGCALQQVATPSEHAKLQSAAALRLAGLTKREREVMALVVDGRANKNIAYHLGISQRTVESHRAAVMKKMGASSLSELVRLDMAAR
jgi:two-component system CheB/CheR fusion protein